MVLGLAVSCGGISFDGELAIPDTQGGGALVWGHARAYAAPPSREFVGFEF
jgi:hypothetical protein